MLTVRVLLVALLASCNAVYGLDSTSLQPPLPPERDNDGDGIVNPDDNCVLLANADQSDSDADGFGDVCDPCADADTQTGVDADGDGVDDGCDSCLNGRNHDEDGDGVGDDCDVCPAVPDPTQSDADGDGVGDACDVDAGMQRRAFFDGFGPPDAAWNTGFKPWHGTSDGYAPVTPEIGNSTASEGPWNSQAIVSGPGVRVVASVIVPPVALVAYSQRVGLSIRSAVNGMPMVTCSLDTNGEDWVRPGDSSSTPIPPGRTRFELVFTPSATAGYGNVTCILAGVPRQSTALYSLEVLYVPSLVANVAAEFEWVEVYE